MKKKIVYRVTLPNFEKYNPNIKKGHKSVLVSVGFLSDAKVRQLSPCGKLMLLSFILVAGESGQSQIEVSHESICYQSGVKSGSVQSQLDLLQSLQLLTYEKIDFLYNRIEKNIIELCSSHTKEQPQPKVLIDRLKYDFSPNKQKFIDVLKKYAQEKNFKFTLPEIMFRFDSPEELESFIEKLDSSEKVNQIGQSNPVKAKDYITVALKREANIIKESK